MLKIDSSKLTINANKAYCDGILFTGIAFTCDRVQVLFAKEYLNGENIGEYKGFLSESEFSDIYVREALDESDEEYFSGPILFNDDKFTGIAYGFEKSYCTSEILVIDSTIVEEITFHYNGIIESYERASNDSGLYQYYEFDKNGNVLSFSLKMKSDFYWSCEFEDGCIRSFECKGSWQCFANILDEKIKFPKVVDLDKILNYKFYPRSYISGDGIEISWINTFIENRCFSKVNYLCIHDVNLSNDCIIKKIQDCNPRISIDID